MQTYINPLVKYVVLNRIPEHVHGYNNRKWKIYAIANIYTNLVIGNASNTVNILDSVRAEATGHFTYRVHNNFIVVTVACDSIVRSG